MYIDIGMKHNQKITELRIVTSLRNKSERHFVTTQRCVITFRSLTPLRKGKGGTARGTKR